MSASPDPVSSCSARPCEGGSSALGSSSFVSEEEAALPEEKVVKMGQKCYHEKTKACVFVCSLNFQLSFVTKYIAALLKGTTVVTGPNFETFHNFLEKYKRDMSEKK